LIFEYSTRKEIWKQMKEKKIFFPKKGKFAGGCFKKIKKTPTPQLSPFFLK